MIDHRDARRRFPGRVGNAPGANLLHRRLIQPAPLIGEDVRIDVLASEVGQKRGDIARNARPPVDHRAEHIEREHFRSRHAVFYPYQIFPGKAVQDELASVNHAPVWAGPSASVYAPDLPLA